MKPVNYDHTPLNEYTIPLMVEPDYTNTGIIWALMAQRLLCYREELDKFDMASSSYT